MLILKGLAARRCWVGIGLRTWSVGGRGQAQVQPGSAFRHV